jgi:hypothetical protein
MKRKFLNGLPNDLAENLSKARCVSAEHTSIHRLLREVKAMKVPSRPTKTIEVSGPIDRPQEVRNHLVRKRIITHEKLVWLDSLDETVEATGLVAPKVSWTSTPLPAKEVHQWNNNVFEGEGWIRKKDNKFDKM